MKLVMLKGLPASGKSTYAKELVAQGYKRVNKDDLRSMIDDGKWSRDNESYIIGMRNIFIERALSAGYNMVVDDTNFDIKHETVLRTLAYKHGAEFEVKFFDTPVNECVERDLKRGEKSVGGDVIFRMYYQYVQPNIVTPAWQLGLPYSYIFDLDGTLAHMKGRSPFDWLKVGEDTVDASVAATLDAHKQAGATIIIVSGRDEVCRDITIKWLKEKDISFDTLLMRPQGDNRKDNIVKKELYENNIKNKFNIVGVYDDRDSVVQMWRSLGLKCFQTDYGTF